MEVTKEKGLTRQQQRLKDRIESEAQATVNLLMGQFLAFLMVAEDPEGEEVKLKRAQLGAKWRTYCKHKGLSKEARQVLDTYMDQCIKDYLAEKEWKANTPETEPLGIMTANIETIIEPIQ